MDGLNDALGISYLLHKYDPLVNKSFCPGSLLVLTARGLQFRTGGQLVQVTSCCSHYIAKLM